MLRLPIARKTSVLLWTMTAAVAAGLLAAPALASPRGPRTA